MNAPTGQTLRVFCLIASVSLLAACGERAASDLSIERLPDVNPSLPEVPEIPPPPYEVEYGDGSYSVYGVRRRGQTTMDTEVSVTGYILEFYIPPVCPEGRTCDAASAPHLWIGDALEPGENDQRLMLAGYAENQTQIDEALEASQRRNYVPPEPEPGIIPIPTDFAVGAKIKVRGRFARMSSAGFNVSNGMLEYRSHEILEPAPGTETEE